MKCPAIPPKWDFFVYFGIQKILKLDNCRDNQKGLSRARRIYRRGHAPTFFQIFCIPTENGKDTC